MNDSATADLNKTTIGASFIAVLLPVIAIVVLGYEIMPFASKSLFQAVAIFIIWKAAEASTIYYLHQQGSLPEYVRIGFQLNIVASNSWFVWIMVFNRASASA